jgi:hypothetical protein
MQLSLPFLENPPLNPEIWEPLDPEERAGVLDRLAKLIAKTATQWPPEEPSHA